jgi:hypothetical protein
VVGIDNLRRLFPGLGQDALETSPRDHRYNCIAWAGGSSTHHWWPVAFPTNGAYWPLPLDQAEESIQGFVAAFRVLGYEICASGDLEPNYEKVALYVDGQKVPTHMARQLPSGNWTSKMGTQLEDIQHATPEEIGGANSAYGNVELFMSRPRQSKTPSSPI